MYKQTKEIGFEIFLETIMHPMFFFKEADESKKKNEQNQPNILIKSIQYNEKLKPLKFIG